MKTQSSQSNIVGVAIIFNEITYCLRAPNRHPNVIEYICDTLNIESVSHNAIQGFIDSEGNFLNRKEAMIRAIETNQLLPRLPGQYSGDKLFSEDLW